MSNIKEENFLDAMDVPVEDLPGSGKTRIGARKLKTFLKDPYNQKVLAATLFAVPASVKAGEVLGDRGSDEDKSKKTNAVKNALKIGAGGLTALGAYQLLKNRPLSESAPTVKLSDILAGTGGLFGSIAGFPAGEAIATKYLPGKGKGGVGTTNKLLAQALISSTLAPTLALAGYRAGKGIEGFQQRLKNRKKRKQQEKLKQYLPAIYYSQRT